jgi:hypothetical protein
MLLALTTLGLPHLAPLPDARTRDERMLDALLALRSRPDRALLVHVIYAQCSCTDRLFRHLIERRAYAGPEEVILFVGENAEREHRARQAGYGFRKVSGARLAEHFGLESAPVLFAFDRSGSLRYAGGYFAHAGSIEALDERIWSEVQRGEEPQGLPIYGCAVSARLQRQVDPLHIVY